MIAYLILGLIYGAPIIFIVLGILVISVGGGALGYLSVIGGIVLVFVYISVYQNGKKEQKEKKEEQERRDDKLNQELQELKDGKWVFPAEKFYRLCQESHISSLDNEFSINKAAMIAKEIIIKTFGEKALEAGVEIDLDKYGDYLSEESIVKYLENPIESDLDIDLENYGEYLKKERLEEFFSKGEAYAKESDARGLLLKKVPRNAKPNEQEKAFLERSSVLSGLSGRDKRKKMLSNLCNDYTKKICDLIKGEEALRKLGMIYADQQKNESSWAIMGGIAEGIAGPAAGLIAASDTIENNRKIQEFNASMRQASMDIMRGIPSVAGNRFQLQEESEKIRKQLDETTNKVVFSQPDATEIWQNIKVAEATVQKNPSGVLEVSLPVTIQEPFVLDVPEGVGMVVDGTIKGEVWFEDKLVGEVFFPLPIYGIPCNMTAEVTLDGMCGRSVEYDGEYTVKIADAQNLWVMEV